MDIASIYFVSLSLASIFVFYLIGAKYRILYLTIISCGFIATFSYPLLIYVLGYTTINYVLGLRIPNVKFKIVLFRFGIFLNLCQLILLNYSSFAIDPLFQIFHSNVHVSKLSEIIVPIGISYFTLQGIGYLINVKMGWEKPEKKFLNFLLYIIYFPKFLSGPIERSNHFFPQLNLNKAFNRQQVTEGLRIVLVGFFKKVVIANQLGLVVNSVYSDVNSFGTIDLWMVLLIQPLFLYFDFSAYTDIAVGLSKTFGINLLPNFKRPFLSENVTTFWKRFHMSLSLWFGDYLFKQLSFKYRRWGKYAPAFAVFVTFTLFGIWHGAGWNFMFLGFIQAVALNFEYFTRKQRGKFFSGMSGFWRIWIGRIITYLFYAGSLIFFFSPNLDKSFNYFSRLLSFEMPIHKYFGGSVEMLLLAILFASLFLIFEILSSDYKHRYIVLEAYWNRYKYFRISFYYFILIFILYSIGGAQEFIYSQF